MSNGGYQQHPQQRRRRRSSSFPFPLYDTSDDGNVLLPTTTTPDADASAWMNALTLTTATTTTTAQQDDDENDDDALPTMTTTTTTWSSPESSSPDEENALNLSDEHSPIPCSPPRHDDDHDDDKEAENDDSEQSSSFLSPLLWSSFSSSSQQHQHVKGGLHHRHHPHHNHTTTTTKTAVSDDEAADKKQTNQQQRAAAASSPLRQRRLLMDHHRPATTTTFHHHHHHLSSPASTTMSSASPSRGFTPSKRIRTQQQSPWYKSWPAMKRILIAASAIWFACLYYLAQSAESQTREASSSSSSSLMFLSAGNSKPTYLTHDLSSSWRLYRHHVKEEDSSFTKTARWQTDWRLQEERQLTAKRCFERQEMRKQRTRPTSAASKPAHSVASLYEFTESKLEMDADEPQASKSGMTAATEHLCGAVARNASRIPALSPFFTRGHALGFPDRTARIVLTNGVQHPLAVPLALYLPKHCSHASVVAVTDGLLPHTSQGRLEQSQDRLALLHKYPPRDGAAVEVVESFYGVGPLPLQQDHTQRKWPRLPNTGDIHVVQHWKPTHVVHFPTVGVINRDADGDALSRLYQIRSTLEGWEHLLSSCAAMPPAQRPHLIYITTDGAGPLASHLARMQQVLALSYATAYGMHIVHMRLPRGLWGPYRDASSARTSDSSTTTPVEGDALYSGDAMEALVAAMQWRPAKPNHVSLALHGWGSAGATFAAAATEERKWNDNKARPIFVPSSSDALTLEGNRTQNYLQWKPATPLSETLLRTHAWSLDHERYLHPGIQNVTESGAHFLHQHGLDSRGDALMDLGPKRLPCASECAVDDWNATRMNALCVPSVLDSMIPLSQSMTTECDIVMYTQSWGRHVVDIPMESEYMEDGTPLICNLAFVSSDSKLVADMLHRVPHSEMQNMGVDPNASNQPEEMRNKLNGRLLYRGWILLWPDSTNQLTPEETFLLKLSPRRFFAPKVKFGLFVEPSLSVTPSNKDVRFLMGQMHRSPWPSRVWRPKKGLHKGKKYRLPPEPERRAILLVSQLRRQESAREKSAPLEAEKVTLRKAVRYMRFEVGDNKGSEPAAAKRQREYYDQVSKWVQGRSDYFKSPTDPMYRLEHQHWARTRWVMHDLLLPEAHALRCEWYQEHVQWGAHPLDQLSLAHILAMWEMRRRMEFAEPDDKMLHSLESTSNLKKGITDAFEWHAIPGVEANRHLADSLYTIDRMAPHSFDDSTPADDHSQQERGLYVRLISDRVMAAARKAAKHLK